MQPGRVWGTDCDAKRAPNSGNLQRAIRTVGVRAFTPVVGLQPVIGPAFRPGPRPARTVQQVPWTRLSGPFTGLPHGRGREQEGTP